MRHPVYYCIILSRIASSHYWWQTEFYKKKKIANLVLNLKSQEINRLFKNYSYVIDRFWIFIEFSRTKNKDKRLLRDCNVSSTQIEQWQDRTDALACNSELTRCTTCISTNGTAAMSPRGFVTPFQKGSLAFCFLWANSGLRHVFPLKAHGCEFLWYENLTPIEVPSDSLTINVDL